MDKTNKVCKENWSYGKIKGLISQLSSEEIKIVKDDSNLLIIQTFLVEPFQKLFISSRAVKDDTDSCDWCYCVPKTNRDWGKFAEISYKQYTKNGENQQYIAFDFTKDFSRDNGSVVAFTVENGKITWSHIMSNVLTEYVEDCNPIFLRGKIF